jgi:F-type H+-transporting ATPase subunit b
MGLNPLEQLNLITMAAMAAIFLVTFVVLRKVFFIPLIDAMEKREGKIGRALARYREAEALAGKAREEAKKIVDAATERAERLSNEVKEEFAMMRETKRAQAGAEADAILVRGREEVARLKETEQARLKKQLLVCSKKTLAKMTPEVDEDALRLVVSRVLAARGVVKRP